MLWTAETAETARQVKVSLESQMKDSRLDQSIADKEAVDLFEYPFKGLGTPCLQKYITENFNYVVSIPE